MQKSGYVYILTNKNNTTFYTGVTSNLIKRIWEHKQKFVDGFSKKYNLTKLVYFDQFDNIQDAIIREKYIKGKKRAFKLSLIEENNKEYRDLYEKILL